MFWLSGKESDCQFRRRRRQGLGPWVRKIPWRRKWQPTPVFLPGNPMDREAWQATVHGITKSGTHLTTCMPARASAHTHTYTPAKDHKDFCAFNPLNCVHVNICVYFSLITSVY